MLLNLYRNVLRLKDDKLKKENNSTPAFMNIKKCHILLIIHFYFFYKFLFNFEFDD